MFINPEQFKAIYQHIDRIFSHTKIVLEAEREQKEGED